MMLGPQRCQQNVVMPLKSVFKRINDCIGYLATEKNVTQSFFTLASNVKGFSLHRRSVA